MASAQPEAPTMPAAVREADGGWMSSSFVPDLVSVIVPTYNRRHLVLETLDSVLAQTYRPIELVVVDDGSTDGSAEAIEAWRRDLPSERTAGIYLRLIRQANGGAPSARNRGLVASRGEFIQFLDSDDLLHPRKLEIHVNRLRAEPRLQYVYSSVLGFASIPDWNARVSKAPPPQLEAHDLLGPHSLHTAAGVYRRSICQAIGPWNEMLRVSQDAEYNIRMILRTRATAFVEGLLVAHRGHPDGRIKTGPAAARLESLDVIEALLSDAGRYDARVQTVLATRLFRIGLAAACQGDADAAREAARRGLRCPSSPPQKAKLVLLAVLCAKTVPDALRGFLAKRIRNFARRNFESRPES